MSTEWLTYATTGYTHDVAQDRASQGGVHLHQVRKSRMGLWQYRICQSNGRHQSYSRVETLTEADGKARYARAMQDA